MNADILNKAYSQMTADERSQARDYAESILRAEYWDDVNGVVDDVKAAIASGEIEDADEAREYAEQSVDGHQRVIYTGKAIDGLRWSENDEAYKDVYENSTPEWSVMMYYAMIQDVMETLEDLDALFTDDEEA